MPPRQVPAPNPHHRVATIAAVAAVIAAAVATGVALAATSSVTPPSGLESHWAKRSADRDENGSVDGPNRRSHFGGAHAQRGGGGAGLL